MFRGESTDEYRIFLGTALMAKYGEGKLPAQYGTTTYEKISMDDTRLYDALPKMRDWLLYESFKNTFRFPPLGNLDYMKAFNDFDKDGQKGKLLKKLGSKFPWGIVTSEIGNSVIKNLGPIPKVDGLDNIKVINVCPVGTTSWKISFNCKPI